MLIELPFFFEFRFPVIITSRADTKSIVGPGKRMPDLYTLSPAA
jgi:hypothetical protein